MEKYTLFDYFFGIFCSLIASFLFAISFYFYLRPNLKISKTIAVNSSKKSDEYYFFFKVINRSFFKLYNIHAELNLVRKDGLNLSKNKLKLLESNVSILNERKFFKPKDLSFACIFITNKKFIDEEYFQGDDLNKDSYLELIIQSTHSITTLTKYYSQTYKIFNNELEIIQRGVFESGNSFKIKKKI